MAQGPGAGRPDLPQAEADDRRGQPPHGLRGGGVPQRRRVLGARHGHVHDPRRRLHTALRVLQRPDRNPDLERPAGAAPRRQPGEEDGPAPRRDHLGRSRRPAGLRRRRVRRRDPLDPPTGGRLQGGGAHAGLPRPGDAAREGDPRAPRRLQPQRRDRAPALPEGAPRLGLPPLRPRAADGEGDGRLRRRDQVGPDGRPRRELRGDARDLRPAARARGPDPHGGPVPAADREPSSGRALLAPGRVRGARARGPRDGLRRVASGPLVRSSYHADEAAAEAAAARAA